MGASAPLMRESSALKDRQGPSGGECALDAVPRLLGVWVLAQEVDARPSGRVVSKEIHTKRQDVFRLKIKIDG